MRRLVLLVLGGALGLACTTGDVATPGEPAPAEVGPAPLRRLSSREIQNALTDLFPWLSADALGKLPELPADVPVAGFDNAVQGQEPSDLAIARYEALADAYATAATRDDASVRTLTGCDLASTTDLATSCASHLLDTFGRRVFRRPLTSEEHARYAERFAAWRSALDFPGAVELTVSSLLQSPQFLYRPEPLPSADLAGSVLPVEPYAMASRLSFFLWESIPDDELLDRAARGGLGTDDDVRAEVLRMSADPRAKRLAWSFHRQWLGLDRILLPEHAVRTPDVDPSWSTATQASALEESRRFVEGTLANGGTLEDLLVGRHAWIDHETARIYGVPFHAPPGAWVETDLPENRAGLLTRVAFLAGFSHRAATSPPVRGNGVELRLLCQLPVSPPPNADLSQPKAAPGSGPQTNRMLFEERTRPAQCQACHAALNGFGFGFEGFDAAGRTQATDDGLPVDTTGTIHGTDVDGPFDGAADLSEKLAHSQVVQHCATLEMVRYALGRAPTAEEMPTVERLAERFRESGGDERALVLGVVTSPTFRSRKVEAR